MTEVGGARAAALRRHPSTSAPVSSSQLAGRLAARLRETGVRGVWVATALLEVRGRCGATVDELASELGVDAGVLRRAEAGELGVADLPGPLRALLAR